MMSACCSEAETATCYASCGKEEVENVTLKKKHWPLHKRTCKKRAADRQPESDQHGNCPICLSEKNAMRPLLPQSNL